MGHITRDCDLADALRVEFGTDVLFLTRDTPSSLEMLKSRGFPILSFPAGLGRAKEQRFVLDVVAEKNPSLFILDMLEVYRNLPFLASLKKHVRTLGCIADNADFFDIIPADFVINGNPCQLKHQYKNTDKYLLGPRYFILGARCAKLSSKAYKVKKKVKKIVMTLGGSDHNDLIFKVLGALKDELSGLDVTVAVGPAFGKDAELRDFIARENMKIKVQRDMPLVPLLSTTDLAITAGGNTLFERLALGVPGITINQLPMQQDIAASFAADGATVNMGIGVDTSPDNMRHAFRELVKDSALREQMSKKGKMLVDGLGIQRIMVFLQARGRHVR